MIHWLFIFTNGFREKYLGPQPPCKYSGGSRGGARGRGPPSLIFGPKWGPKDRKKIFLEAGPSLISGSVYSFKYGVNKLNNVKSYKYLGMTLNPHGNFSLAREELKKVGLKVLYKLRKEKGDNFRENIMLTIKLFDALPRTSIRKWNLGCWL